jgi:hypothetical protein
MPPTRPATLLRCLAALADLLFWFTLATSLVAAILGWGLPVSVLRIHVVSSTEIGESGGQTHTAVFTHTPHGCSVTYLGTTMDVDRIELGPPEHRTSPLACYLVFAHSYRWSVLYGCSTQLPTFPIEAADYDAWRPHTSTAELVSLAHAVLTIAALEHCPASP